MSSVVALLDRPGARTLLARAMEWKIRRRYGETVRVRFDTGQQLWIFEWPDVTVPMTEPGTTSPQAFEKKHTDIFFQEYRPRAGDVVLDLGAGIGTELALVCRLVGDAGRVYAVEADPRTFRCLTRRKELNGIDNAVLIQTAVANEPGEVMLSTEGSHLGHHLTEGPGCRVPATTIDSLVAEHGIERIDLLKINIEGAEQQAFEGMTRSIALVRNVAVSCHDFIGFPTTAFVRSYLQQHGFTVTGRRADDPRVWAQSWLYARRA